MLNYKYGGERHCHCLFGVHVLFLWFPLNGLVNPSLSSRDANMRGPGEAGDGGARNGEGFIVG